MLAVVAVAPYAPGRRRRAAESECEDKVTGEDALRQRQRERDELLDRIVAALRTDERVAAAWFAGSLGRGDADAWSDLDVWVVVEDEHAGAVIAGSRSFVAAVGSPLLILEAPQNAPADVAYLLVLYPGRAGPQQVDWYW